MSYRLSQILHMPGCGRTRVRLASSAAAVLALLATACGGDDTVNATPAAASADASQSPVGDIDSSNDSMEDAMSDVDTAAGDSMADDMSSMTMMMETVASESWDGMRVELAAMPPTTFTLFQGTDATLVEPGNTDSVHLMAVLADDQSGERIPYADVWVTLRDSDGSIVFDERMWPMLSRAMGTHYGINVPLPEAGTYSVELQVGAPQGARHPEYAERWLEPSSFEMTYTWNG